MRRLTTFLLMVALLAALAVPVAAQAQTTTEELLSGMVTEEVEPGVYRVLHDGVRDVRYSEVSVRPDGSIFLVNHDEYGYVDVRLGSPDDEAFTLPEGSVEPLDGVYPVVAPDGTYWAYDTRVVLPDGTDWSGRGLWDAPEGAREVTRLHSLEDGSWTVRAEAPDMERWTITPDGTVWAAYRGNGPVVARLGADRWEPLEDPPSTRGLVVTESGEVWVGGDLGGTPSSLPSSTMGEAGRAPVGASAAYSTGACRCSCSPARAATRV